MTDAKKHADAIARDRAMWKASRSELKKIAEQEHIPLAQLVESFLEEFRAKGTAGFTGQVFPTIVAAEDDWTRPKTVDSKKIFGGKK